MLVVLSPSRVGPGHRTIPRLGLIIVAALVFGAPAWGTSRAVTLAVNVNDNGDPANGESHVGGMGPRGRYVVFDSLASNLAPGDGNDAYDVFLRDSLQGTTELVSTNLSGQPGNGESLDSSFDGFRYVAFASSASDLVRDDNNGVEDVFLRDRQTGTTRRISASIEGTDPNGPSYQPDISEGSVSFASDASNLVPNDTNGFTDIFVYSISRGTTERISVASDGGEANGPSREPSGPAFVSEATNLVPNDTNGVADIFVHRAGFSGFPDTVRVTQSRGRAQANGPSDNPVFERFSVAYESLASNLVHGDTNGVSDVFKFTFKGLGGGGGGKVLRVSVSATGAQGNGPSYLPSFDQSVGNYISFASLADNLVAGDNNDASDVFVYGGSGTPPLRLMSVNTSGVQGNDGSFGSRIGKDYHDVVFDSNADNLAPINPGSQVNVFLRSSR